jgi:hypothetical protein
VVLLVLLVCPRTTSDEYREVSWGRLTFLELTGAALDADAPAPPSHVHPEVVARPRVFRGGGRCSELVGRHSQRPWPEENTEELTP